QVQPVEAVLPPGPGSGRSRPCLRRGMAAADRSEVELVLQNTLAGNKEAVFMHRGLAVLLVFTGLVLIPSTALFHTKAASAAQNLTVRDVEKITDLHVINLVPPALSKGAGG